MSTYFARERIIDALASIELALTQDIEPADRERLQTAVNALELVSMRLDALPPARSHGALSALLLTVQAEWGVEAADIKSDRREQPIAEARQVWCWLARHATPSSLPRIGRYIDRDHTTVKYAIAQVERRRQADADFARRLDRLKRHADKRLTHREEAGYAQS